MEQHITDFLNNINQLAALGQHLTDELQAALLLQSLPDSYDTLVTTLEGRPDKDLTVDLVKGKLIDEYKKRLGSKYTKENYDNEAAMKSTFKNISNGSQSKRSCFFCKKSGHFKSECIKYKAWKNKEKANKAAEERRQDFCLLARDGKASKDACLTVKESYVWVVDSGATSHMVNTKDFFKTFDSNRKGHVRLADDGKLAAVQGIGSGSIKCSLGKSKQKIAEICVSDVLYVPSLGSNLLSVKKLAKAGHKIIFQDNDCFITKNGVLQATACLSPELYEIKAVDKACIAEATPSNTSHGINCQHVWHRRFGHRDFGAIKKLAEKGLATGIQVKECDKLMVCECCVRGKMARTPFSKKSKHKKHAILDLIHTDVCGPMHTVTPSQKRYILTIIDDFSRYTYVYLMSHKDEASPLIKDFIEMAKTQFNTRPKIIRSDRGGEYVNTDLQTHLRKEGIAMQCTAPYSPQQNGVAERKNRSLIEMTRCMLIDAKLDKKYWGEAVVTANYLQNRLPSRSIEKTPYELWYSRKPDVANLHIFGSEAMVLIHKEQRKKLDDKAEKLIFVGYSEVSKAFRFLNLRTNRIKISRDAVFLDKVTKTQNSEDSGDELIFTKCEKIDQNNLQDISFDQNSVCSNDEYLPTTEGLDESSSSSSEEENSPNNNTKSHEEVQQPQFRRSQRENRGVPPDRYVAKLAKEESEPRSAKEALLSENKEEWKKSMDDEIESLKKNNTWDVVPKPPDANIVSCKWVFKTKRNAEGNVERHKARLVARGFSQKYGTDYDEVFAPVVRQTTFRTLLTVASYKNMTIKHFDAKTAFLNGLLKEKIFMQQPEGYIISGKEDYVCRLNKGIYGLKQAAKIWNDQLDNLLKTYGFTQSKTDSCLYTKLTEDEIIYLIIYVDDILIAAKSEEKINEVANFLMEQFNLVDLGNLKHYLGIEVSRNKDGFYCIKQNNYIDKIINRFGLQDAKISKIPLDPGYLKIKNNHTEIMRENEKYQQLIGALLYLAVNTRPDIAASITILSQKNKEPTEMDWTEAKRVVRYLKGTKDYTLQLGQRHGHKGLVGYADADWAEDTSDRKSNSGYVFQLHGSTISWGCRKQTCVSLSSTEAEYIALAEATQEGIWLRRLIEDFNGKKMEEKIVIYEDNQSCIKLIDNKKFSNRTKHIDTKFHFIRDLKEKGIIGYEYCPTNEMTADMLTKPLKNIKLKHMSEKCGLIET